MINNFYFGYKMLIKTAVAVVLSLMTISGFSQMVATNTIRNQFDKYTVQQPDEKIFVHTDRNFYLAGEIVWFKIYCTDGENKLLGLSKVAYVEVLDRDQAPLMQVKVALQDGTGSGSMLLPVNARSGNYLLRAYTNWMKNSDPGLYFNQNITVINTLQTDTISAPASDVKYDVQFFPEGGDMVNDLPGKVAFRMADNTGHGVNFNGAVTDEKNDTILHFHPSVFGIGNFEFTPKNSQQYKAFVITPSGKVITQNLPAARTTGFVIHLSENSEKSSIKISVQTNTGQPLAYLFIHTRKQVAAAQLLTFTNGSASFEIDKSQLGDGISHITLFDKDNEPVCERLYCKHPQQQLAIDAKSDAAEYLPRKKVTIDLLSKDDANAQSAEMSMSVALIDTSSFSYTGISDYLWLTSELQGNIESPEYYFQAQNPNVDDALDNLMLTHGWRRFKWQDVLQDKKPVLKFLPEYEGHIISGKVMKRADETPANDVSTFLSIPGSHFQLYTSKSAVDGTVHFNTVNFYGSKLMVALVNAPAPDAYRVDLANPFSEDFSSDSIPMFDSKNISSPALLKRSIYMQVQNAYFAASLNRFENHKTDSLNFYGKADTKYMLDDYTRFPTMEEVLREYVIDINVRKKRDEFFLTMVSKDEVGNPIIKDPVILLDGVPQFDFGNKITHYDPLKVQRLETVNEAYYLGNARFNGIASFFTYKGNLEGFPLDTAETVIDYDALQLRREFFSPLYETKDQYSSRLPDFRSLLYWSPDVQTDERGTKKISFYTSDVPGKYAVVIQGISQLGKAGSKVIMFDVKKNPSDIKRSGTN